MDFTDEDMPKAGFTDKDIRRGPQSIFERIGQGYKDITAKPRENIARAIEGGVGPFTRLTKPNREPGAFSRFVSGLAVPETATQAVLMAIAPGVGKLGKFATSGPWGQAIKGGLTRAGIMGGAGAATSAATGDSPVVGGLEGVVSSVAGDVMGSIFKHARKDVLPLKADGYTRAKMRFAPPVDLSVPQPDNWLRAIVDDLPVLRNHVREVPDLMKMVSEVTGKRVSKVSPLVRSIEKEIYAPVTSRINAMGPNVKIDMPQLDPHSINNIMIQDPSLKAALTNVHKKVLELGDRLTPAQALDLIQMVKEEAWKGTAGKMRGVVRKFADDLDKDFTAALSRIDPAYGGGRQLADMYVGAKSQYSKLKDFVWVLSKDAGKLLPIGSDLKPGINPVAWAETFRQYPFRLSSDKWPRLNKAVTLGMGPGGGAAVEGPTGGTMRAYAGLPAPLEVVRIGNELLKISPKAILAPPKPPLSLLFRSLFPATMSGLESLGVKPEDQPRTINRTVNPWAR